MKIKLAIPLNPSDGLGYPYLKGKDVFRHLYVVGKTQTGKSTFFLNIINQILDNAIIVVDPKGSFAENVKNLAPKDRLIYIDKKNPIVINPLKRRNLGWSESAIEFAEVMNACIEGTTSSKETTTLMKEIILNAVRVFNPSQRNLTYLSDFLNYVNVRFAHLGITDTDVKLEKIIKEHLYNKFDPYWINFDAKDSRNWLVNREKVESAKRVGARLSTFITHTVMRKFTVGENQLEIPDIVRDRKILIFNLKGFDTDSKIYLGNLITHAVKSYFNYQAGKGSPPLFLYVDEFQTFITPFFDEMLSQAAEYNISVNVAHQNHDKVEKKTLGTVLGNCHTLVTFNCGYDEASRMANEMGITSKPIMNLNKYEVIIKIGNELHNPCMTYKPPKIEAPQYNFLKDAWFPC